MTISFSVTGCAAHSRISPLLPTDWEDVTSRTCNTMTPPSLLWENAPRHETKDKRDGVRCYSHLPNGTDVLDSKWALARFMCRVPQHGALATLETYCFRGRRGFDKFWKEHCHCPHFETTQEYSSLPDLVLDPQPTTAFPAPNNLWVIKDASSNGAGGIWVVGEENHSEFETTKLSPLVDNHRYIAQKYTWPMVLFGGRKCHVRVYGLFTCDGRAFLHDKCFLHVANEPFQTTSSLNEHAVHITNCCANSHDPDKFAGEITASLISTNFDDATVDLSKFFPSVAASVATLAEKAFPYLRGGDVNGGFEYLGIDFILSERDHQPVAYLLEVNAPPSQDTATGLPHAENLHNAVISDLISLWVLPRVIGASPKLGGWKCVFQDQNYFSWNILPSKAVILNKIRWAIFERKLAKEDSPDSFFVPFVRSHFPYFPSEQIFFENAGGSQVPRQVIERVVDSLKDRNRCVIGSRIKEEARATLLTLLGTSAALHKVFLGLNATALLETLANKYMDKLQPHDEILLATENHLANVTAWTCLAKKTGATIKWWRLGSPIDDVVTSKTRIVAISHASNILGQVRDIHTISKRIKEIIPHSIIVVDGVAAAPHTFANLENNEAVDWYTISCHKLFGPHLGALCGRIDAVKKLQETGENHYGWFESGTLNYEACSGVVGLGAYFQHLAAFEKNSSEGHHSALQDKLSTMQVISAYQHIHTAEKQLVESLRKRLKANQYIRVIEDSSESCRLPLFAFSHKALQASEIVASFYEMGIQCRSGTFLSTEQLQDELNFGSIVRLSLAHYNTISEINEVMGRLQQLQGSAQQK